MGDRTEADLLENTEDDLANMAGEEGENWLEREQRSVLKLWPFAEHLKLGEISIL